MNIYERNLFNMRYKYSKLNSKESKGIMNRKTLKENLYNAETRHICIFYK